MGDGTTRNDRKSTGEAEPPHLARLRALRFSILNWSAWSPELETRSAWSSWAGGSADLDDATPPPTLPMMMRRRLSPFGQRLVGATSACAVGLPAARYVLSTRHGELTRALATLGAIETEGLPSPTDFSMAIHHALLGLLSIHAGNRGGHTALSAGRESFANGLLEAVACIAERPGEPVILVHGDEKLPEGYEAFRESDDAALPLVVALAIGPPGASLGNDFTLEVAPAATNAVPTGDMASEFLRFFLSDALCGHAVGRRTSWIWRRVA